MAVQTVLLLTCVLLHVCPSLAVNKLLVMLVDGLREDYPTRDLHLLQFQAIEREGVKAQYVTPAFPAKSYPNYYSIMTGLYTESHGMTGNYMYDAERNVSFLVGFNQESFEPFWWENAEPLWITATKAGKKANMYYWPGCQVTIRNTVPNKCIKLTDLPSFENMVNSIDEIVQLFSDDVIDMAGLYYQKVDIWGHRYGPDSELVRDKVQEVDITLGYLRQKLTDTGLDQSVNVMILSDHGMAPLPDYSVTSGYISLKDYVDVDDLKRPTLYSDMIVHIWPKDGLLEKVYSDLRNVPHSVVLKKEDIPEDWHYKRGKYVAPLLLLAQYPWLVFEDSAIPWTWDNASHFPRGSHGFSSSRTDMKGVFMAFGPDFRKGYEADPIDIVDEYQLMCRLLDITPLPNNGTWARVEGMLDGAIYTAVSQYARVVSTLAIAQSTLVFFSFYLVLC
ncbi:glycerophosphocholine cholinephosphodiesterase ENPP6-like [Branchiostoma lanceolatum]|uniref:glycerophosphocholine cholinephosphodiesterase ENPP6-like n=1 Tax=Branchiostoma lanceolatum TaxID=7740 RepID=UPI003455A1C0